ncbi:MAG: polymerase sigma factor, sigma-70 family [Frankiales bacterium]|nr:polymerase sigma factor, sigma-70 family [Frankiales bacterium]
MRQVSQHVQPGFDDLYYASYASVLRAVVLLVPTREDAHDVVQEAYARALSRWDVVGCLEAPEGWVRKVAVNAAIDLGRRERSGRAAHRRLFGRPSSVPAPDSEGVDVARALATLPAAQRQAIVLHYLLDLSVAQIADETGRPVNTVKTNLARGRTALAARLRVPAEATLDV